MSCDNLHGNGAVLRQVVLGLADMQNPDLADWISQNGAFPNSMVDCIVPGRARTCAGTRQDGSTIEPNDPIWPTLTQAAHEARERPAVWLEQRQLYGDLASTAAFAEAFSRWLGALWRNGKRETLTAFWGD